MLTIGLYGVGDRDGSGASHDHGVAVMENGRVVTCQELERVTRRKHDGTLEAHLGSLLRPFLLPGQPVCIALANSFVGARFCSTDGMIEIDGATDLEVPEMTREGRGRIVVDGAVVPARFFSVSHEIAHVATCLPFFGPFQPDNLLVHVDGGASRSCASAWHFDGHRLACLDHGWHAGLKGAVNNFNDSQLARRILGLGPGDHLSMPGKLMGLASFGRRDRTASEWLAEREWLRHDTRPPEAVVRELQRELPRLGLAELSARDPGSQVLAACMQRHVEDEILAYIGRFRRATNARHLYYSGGAALNIHANARIERELGFSSVSIPPAPSDAGLALGAAAFLEWRAGHPIAVHTPFLNQTRHESRTPAAAAGLPVVRTPEEAARLIAEGRVVGVWTGRAELGPRALGHRSLLARPDSVEIRRRLSEGMKRREWYRPVAPMMLSEVATEALDGFVEGSALGRFMLGAWTLRPAWAAPFAGCVHADGTVRAQIVDGREPELRHIYNLLMELKRRHGVQGAINTSFNPQGVPIVHELEEAVRAALEMGVDALWLPATTEASCPHR